MAGRGAQHPRTTDATRYTAAVPPDYDRVIAIGDLNGAAVVLRDILRGTGVIDESDRWIAGTCHFIQLGDIFDRGGGVCEALDLLARLEQDAREHGGRVTVLLGNHEVMAARGDRRWCSPDEFLWFASEEERTEWPLRVERARQEIANAIEPDAPPVLRDLRLNRWMHHNAPGQDALWQALEPDGWIGKQIRSLPIAIAEAGCVFSHAGLIPRWARLGLEGVNQTAHNAWTAEPEPDGILHSATGPLWNRELVLERNDHVSEQIAESLKLLDTERLVVGHTPTANIPGSEPGRIAVLEGGRVVAIDVGLDPGTPGAALIIENGRGIEWMPSGTRVLWSAG